MQIFHLALASDWRRARREGSYTVSTRGVDLAEQGFIHCSQDFQVEDVRARFYADVAEPLVLLTIDTRLLDVPWRLDEVPGSPDPFPHVYGPLNLDAVVATRTLG